MTGNLGHRSLWRPLLCAALMVGVTAPRAHAQDTRVFGTVRDTSGHPIPMVRLSSGGALTITDSSGRFSLGGLAAGNAQVSVRRLGYSPLDTTLAVVAGHADTLSFVLVILPQDLPGITSNMDEILRTRLPEFYRHRRLGGGVFFDRRDIEARHPQLLSDLLRTLAGARVTERGGRSSTGSSRGSGRACPMDVWIDGVRAAGMNSDDVGVNDIEAVEFYRGPSGLPPELNDRFGHPGCGAIVIWTRLPG